MGLIKNYQRSLIDRVKENKATFIIYTILRVLIVVVMIRSIFIGNYEGVFTCILTLLLLLIPSFLKGALRISIPPLFESIIYLFIFSANILGELAHFYAHIPIWDTMLHTLNGFLFAAVGYSTVELLNRSSKKIKLSPLYLTLVAFCVSMTIGVLWEFFECGMDLFFGTDMQKDFIVDTIRSTKLDPTNNQNVIVVKDIVNTTITTRSGEVTVIDGGYLDIGILDTMKDLCACILTRAVSLQLKRGLIREYVTEEDELKSPEGKIDITASITSGVIQNHRLICAHDEFSENSVRNRIVKQTLTVLLASDVKQEYRTEIRKLIRFFTDVDFIDPHTINWSMAYDRNNQSYRFLIAICKLVLKDLLMAQSDGTFRMMDLLDERAQHAIYEKFILEYYRREHPELKAGAPYIAWALDDGFDDWLSDGGE